jgi:dipeptidyl aminopeptidase/acylaminoacyl peptidase
MSSAATLAPYGSWRSSLSAAKAAAGSLRLGDVQMDEAGVYWVEGRPTEDGRCAVVHHREGSSHDLVGAPFSARTTVHEYGGGALRVAGGSVYFANQSDQRIYRMEVDSGPPSPLTADTGDVRFADMALDAPRNRLISVVEDHRAATVRNDLQAIDLETGALRPLVFGNDFYACPRISPDGSRLAWITWNQPNMPWDGTELWLGALAADGSVSDARCVAGGRDDAIFQPHWSPSGVLHFCSDRSGFWNLHRLDGERVTAVAPMEADCGEPLWVFGLSTFAFCGGDRIALIAAHEGTWRMHILDERSGAVLTDVDLPFTSMRQLVSAGDVVAMVAGGPRHGKSVVTVDTRSGAFAVLRASSEQTVDESTLSVAQPITFTGARGDTAHAFFYAPRNDSAQGPPGELPPLLVRAHGGPTSATDTALNAAVQYWTSRGFAFVDVNYGGSAGYGRAYRRRLNGQEGVVDVEDCIAAARHLATEGFVDGSRTMITGGSAGGYIVLCAMTFHDAFAAGADQYGICDWETMIRETHKFEARYFDSMIGPYPEQRDRYYARSPIHFIDRVRQPIIIFQGLEDRIVPPNQSATMYEALRSRGVPCAYIAFEGEQHGFRRQANIARALEAELLFYCQVLHLEPADSIEPIDIAHADRL